MGDSQTLVIDGSASVESPLIDLRRKRLVSPARSGGNCIEMMQQDQSRSTGYRSLGTSVEKRLTLRRDDPLGGHPGLMEKSAQIGARLSRPVEGGGVDLDVMLEPLGGFVDRRLQRLEDLAWKGDRQEDEQETGRSTHGGVRV